MQEHDVVVAGGGPTGMMLAGELTLAGVDVVVVERRASHDIDDSRAGGLHARTIEVLDQRGIAERFLSEGQTHPTVGYAGFQLDLSDAPARHNHLLALWQRDFERIMGGWMSELDVPFRRGADVETLADDGHGVDVGLSDGSRVRGRYLVGCDGGRSTVRKAAGIEFPGHEPSVSFMIAEAETAEVPEFGMRPEGGGIGPVDRSGTGGNDAVTVYRMALKEERVDHVEEPTLDDLRATLVRLYGTDFGLRSASWISRFTDRSRQAAEYRRGRVLLAGDAAHVHGPYGGQGLNLGVQDAVNLGWKLARVVQGRADGALLDTYHAERHPIGARVLRNTMAQATLAIPDPRHEALRDTVGQLLALDGPRRRIAAEISGLDVHYDLDGDHPMVGRRMPDLDLGTDEGVCRVFELLHEAQGILLSLDGTDLGSVPTAVPTVVPTMRATHDGPIELPVLGVVSTPAAVLVRPDGYVAWAGTPDEPSLQDAIGRWFGGPAAA